MTKNHESILAALEWELSKGEMSSCNFGQTVVIFCQSAQVKLLISPSAMYSKLKYSYSNLTNLTYAILRLVQIDQIWNENLACGEMSCSIFGQTSVIFC